MEPKDYNIRSPYALIGLTVLSAAAKGFCDAIDIPQAGLEGLLIAGPLLMQGSYFAGSVNGFLKAASFEEEHNEFQKDPKIRRGLGSLTGIFTAISTLQVGTGYAIGYGIGKLTK